MMGTATSYIIQQIRLDYSAKLFQVNEVHLGSNKCLSKYYHIITVNQFIFVSNLFSCFLPERIIHENKLPGKCTFGHNVHYS